jgi:hypothetical protein
VRRHGDFAVGLALAWRASRMRHAEYGYRGRGGIGGDRLNYPKGMEAQRPAFRPPLGARIRGSI